MELCETRADGKTPMDQSQQQVFLIVRGKKTIKMTVNTAKAFLPEDRCCEFTILSSDVAVEKWEVIVVFMFDCEVDVMVLCVQIITKLLTRCFILE